MSVRIWHASFNIYLQTPTKLNHQSVFELLLYKYAIIWPPYLQTAICDCCCIFVTMSTKDNGGCFKVSYFKNRNGVSLKPLLSRVYKTQLEQPPKNHQYHQLKEECAAGMITHRHQKRIPLSAVDLGYKWSMLVISVTSSGLTIIKASSCDPISCK